jgi:hypothetical protein
LLVAPHELDPLIERLHDAPLGSWRAKDILRAASLPLLDPKRSVEVADKLAKIAAKEALSPILLLVMPQSANTQIADGYHRACAALITQEDTLVPGRILFA